MAKYAGDAPVKVIRLTDLREVVEAMKQQDHLVSVKHTINEIAYVDGYISGLEDLLAQLKGVGDE